MRDFRRESSDHIQQILALIRDLVLEVRTQLPEDQSEIVFIVDNLEKIPDGETETKVSLHETLFLRELPLLDVPAHLVLTYPISLNYSSVALRQVFHNARQTTIPMVGIRQKPGTFVRGDDVQGIAALRRLLARRVRLPTPGPSSDGSPARTIIWSWRTKSCAATSPRPVFRPSRARRSSGAARATPRRRAGGSHRAESCAGWLRGTRSSKGRGACPTPAR